MTSLLATQFLLVSTSAASAASTADMLVTPALKAAGGTVTTAK